MTRLRVSPRLGMRFQYLADAAVWVCSLYLAAWLRYLDSTSAPNWTAVAVFALVAAIAQGIIGGIRQLYRGKYLYGSFDEVQGVVVTVILTSVVLLALDFAWPGALRPVPISALVIAVAIAVIGMLAVRYLLRRVREFGKRPTEAEPALVFGVGDAGSQLVTNMLRDNNSPYLPVGLLDDAPHKQRLTIYGVKTLGTREDIAAAAEMTGATALIIGTTTASARTVRDVTSRAEAAGLHVKILPPLSELIGGQVGVTDLRDVDLPDLLGRHEVSVDLQGIAGYLSGKRVLVTGAGGSIGSELCRQLAQLSPAQLVHARPRRVGPARPAAVDPRPGPADSTQTVVLADIRDADRLDEVFRRPRPQVVFHAAALKHLPMLERHPDEALKTNVVGT